ncbi:hypothetical protein HELRODRAFT_168146 [Helobdella robusta]|uniref:Uncharacterized protein n=1 Tax=Helobdella robusta TaxID=6412 RepID=T1F080_HELRO|nr:hypothetical protein HELRODRAFT_168146 [Helobdella robusta]ESO10255.1 hypothetical protein HELRODRAFT_168146 [Helobdella robusta]
MVQTGVVYNNLLPLGNLAQVHPVNLSASNPSSNNNAVQHALQTRTSVGGGISPLLINQQNISTGTNSVLSGTNAMSLNHYIIGDYMLPSNAVYQNINVAVDSYKRFSMNFENRWVLRSALNFASDGEVVREVGREFQRKGPEKAKADLAKECLTRVKKKREQENDRKPGRLERLSLRHIKSDQAIIEERHRDKL